MKIYILFLLTIMIFGILIFNSMYKSNLMLENFDNYDIYSSKNTSLGGYEDKSQLSKGDILLEDSYPVTGRNGISTNDASSIWWHYPIFKVGSYDQITNNIKYPNNPDVGTCMPASMCGALYKEKQLKSNYIKPLPPIIPDCGTRIGYFNTPFNLLPFRTDIANILY